jgi:6-phosphofructokinase 1
MILEVMGRDAGHIALAAGIAGGADVILIPEIPYHIDYVAAHIKKLRSQGRNFALMVVSEAVRTVGGKRQMTELYGGQKRLGGVGHIIGAQIAELCAAETRVTILGHVQRGGQPSAQDRLIAAAFGVHAVDLIAAGKFNRMVAWSNRHVIDVPIADAVKHYQMVEKNGSLVHTARGLGICLGDKAKI